MAKITRNNRITIPLEIMKLKGWEVGEEVVIIPHPGDQELSSSALVVIHKIDGTASQSKRRPRK